MFNEWFKNKKEKKVKKLMISDKDYKVIADYAFEENQWNQLTSDIKEII